jgi:hypothetical protein
MRQLDVMYQEFNYRVDIAELPDEKPKEYLMRKIYSILQKCQPGMDHKRKLLIVHYGGHGCDSYKRGGLVILPREKSRHQEYVRSFPSPCSSIAIFRSATNM